ncbi:hypothetical protein B0T24DRAFT_80705 [Lasiosphaeria ovina]|uniref:Septation protein imp2 n=1 Tax=Lasiosphaeria ovina TaxID=92902 RepID=A0AAE0NMK5_9PEZI|nr:hypothetical protein B0T24DRAFT_80705 [Lasiosphaeria ovina]
MPAATNDGPAVALSFANNFWGKDDAGVGPLLERMHAAKQTCDELRAFYSARSSIEDEYARKLFSLCRKSLGSQEMGTLRASLDVVRGEVESIAKQHNGIAAQMKSELEEPLAAFAGGMKERRKIVQNTVEKLLKTKIQQTQMVNKTRDRYEQECLKIKGYLAQGHMVMGQEERKNKAKLEKTQISLATSNSEYEAAVKALEETTARWNREWKAAADKFQDLEEERLDFTKSSLWTFANIASTVCVSDDASCEKIRLSLEKMEVEKDILNFISERGTGQEIPDPPKYINFCRGDVDSQSEASEDESYSVAQFPRSINPAFRSSSPQPSTYESHHDPNSTLARNLVHDVVGDVGALGTPKSRENTVTPQKLPPAIPTPQEIQAQQQQQSRPRQPRGYQPPRANLEYDPAEFAPVPHDPYPMDGMTMLCRPTASDLSSAPSGVSSVRPSSRDSHSETSFSSQEPASAPSPTKQQLQQHQPAPATPTAAGGKERNLLKKRSGFFQNHSPFRRKSTKEVASPAGGGGNGSRNTWHPSNNGARSNNNSSSQMVLPPSDHRSASPDPIAANASLALNVGQNVFPVETPDRRSAKAAAATAAAPEDDPIALALAEIKGFAASSGSGSGSGTGKVSSVRISADHYHGIATPAPGATSPLVSRSAAQHQPPPPIGGGAASSGMRGTPPPSYGDHQVQVQRLGVPPPAVTAKAMKESSQKFQQQTRSIFNPAASSSSSNINNNSNNNHDRPGSSYGGSHHNHSSSMSRSGTRSAADLPRAASPAPLRSVSPRPASRNGGGGYGSPAQQHRSVSPNPYGGGSSSQRGSISGGSGQQQPRGQPNYQRAPSQQNSQSHYSQQHSHRGSDQGLYKTASRGGTTGDYRHSSPHDFNGGGSGSRAVSPAPPFASSGRSDYGRPDSSSSSVNMAVQLAPVPGDEGGGSVYGGSQRGRAGTGGTGRPGTSSSSSRAMSFYDGSSAAAPRQRSKSVVAADPAVAARGYTRDGRGIMHFARALYMYQAAIPEELGFAKGDMLAVIRHQDDGWWEATIQGGDGRVGLVPSNYLQQC